MKKILYLRTDLGTQDLISGGSVTHTLGVIDGLIAQQVTVYCASSAIHTILQNKSGIMFTPLNLPRWISFFGFKISCILSNLFFFLQAYTSIYNVQIDYVYQRYSMLNMVGIILAKLKKVPLVLEFNGSEAWVDAHWSPNKKISARRLIMFFERWNLEQSDYIVVVSHVLKNMLITHGIAAHKILVNPNGVDIQFFDPEKYQKSAYALRAELGITEKFVFGFIGSFSYWHGIEIISAMIPKIAHNNGCVHFLLIGSGPLLEACRKTIDLMNVSDAVTFVGRISYKNAPKYLAACDAFLCPSQPNVDGTPFFGSPTKLFEYMSMGKPIIASRVDQLEDIIDSSFGILVDHDDIDGFVVAAQKVIASDVHMRKVQGDAARYKAVHYFSWQQHVNNIQTFLT